MALEGKKAFALLKKARFSKMYDRVFYEESVFRASIINLPVELILDDAIAGEAKVLWGYLYHLGSVVGGNAPGDVIMAELIETEPDKLRRLYQMLIDHGWLWIIDKASTKSREFHLIKPKKNRKQPFNFIK